MTTNITKIPKKVQSGNRTVWHHWRVYQRYRDSWYQTLALFFPQMSIWPATRVRVQITSVRKRLLDKGNFIQGCKPILDYLVSANYLRDDSPTWVDDQYVQRLGKEEFTEIQISKPSGDQNEQSSNAGRRTKQRAR